MKEASKKKTRRITSTLIATSNKAHPKALIEYLETAHRIISAADSLWIEQKGRDWRRPGSGLPIAGLDRRFPWPPEEHCYPFDNQDPHLRQRFDVICKLVHTRLLGKRKAYIYPQMLEATRQCSQHETMATALQQRLVFHRLIRTWKLKDLDDVISIIQLCQQKIPNDINDISRISELDTTTSGRSILHNLAASMRPKHRYIKQDLVSLSGFSANTYRSIHDILIRERYLHPINPNNHNKVTAMPKLLQLIGK